MKKRALISVSDKTGVIEFAKELAGLGFEIISTGGTAAALTKAGVANIGISDITGFPECLDGRVKTLHPNVHAGLLAVRSNPEHMKQLIENGVNTIDVVCVNLYPFKATITKPDCTTGEAIENIDIGGPTMLRSAAKNYQDVIVLCDPKDYSEAVERLKGDTADKDFRLRLMYKVFAHTAMYDSMISGYLAGKLGIEFPDSITLAYEKAQGMRYGENPHQQAAFYRECFDYAGSITSCKQLHGKELSFNNINDTNGAIELLREFTEPTIVAVKHSNPCGVGSANDIYSAYIKAYEADPVSIFGGIIASNREIDEKTALKMSEIFLEVVVAPAFSVEALAVLQRKANIRLLTCPDISVALKAGTKNMKKVLGGLLIQDIDSIVLDNQPLKVMTKRAPTAAELEQLIFAFKVVKHAKSNAIAIAKDGCSIGIGVGQTNRIWATNQAIEHAGNRCVGAVMASDAFFPFPDCVEAAAKAGITAIIQPCGSNNDQLSIDACDKYGIAMVSSNGIRHFLH